jgi:hypothetical protein
MKVITMSIPDEGTGNKDMNLYHLCQQDAKWKILSEKFQNLLEKQ